MKSNDFYTRNGIFRQKRLKVLSRQQCAPHPAYSCRAGRFQLRYRSGSKPLGSFWSRSWWRSTILNRNTALECGYRR